MGGVLSHACHRHRARVCSEKAVQVDLGLPATLSYRQSLDVANRALFEQMHHRVSQLSGGQSSSPHHRLHDTDGFIDFLSTRVTAS